MVTEFTRATGFATPSTPHEIPPDQLKFLAAMIIDETLELLATEFTPEEAKAFLCETVEQAKNVPKLETTDKAEKIAEQGDALVDIEYYMLNAASKHGIDVEEMFTEVHASNMRKVDPESGRVIRDPATGKVLKPPGWKTPDLVNLVRQRLNRE